jgi:hypothetical protein
MREEFIAVLDTLMEQQILQMIDREHFLILLDGKVIGTLVAPEVLQNQEVRKKTIQTRQLHFFKAKPSLRKYQALIGNQVLLNNDLERLVNDALIYYRMKRKKEKDYTEPIYQV